MAAVNDFILFWEKGNPVKEIESSMIHSNQCYSFLYSCLEVMLSQKLEELHIVAGPHSARIHWRALKGHRD